MIWLLVALGGALGSVCRYGFGRLVLPWSALFPFGTLGVNLIGGFAMGVVVGLFEVMPPSLFLSLETRAFLTVGILGGFTTFSSFSLDVVTLIDRDALGLAVLYAAGSVAGAIGGVALGRMMMRSFA